jgi:ATP-dependent Zn protease
MNFRQQLLLSIVAGLAICTSACLGDFTKQVFEVDRFSQAKNSLKYSEFIQQVESGKIKKVELSADGSKLLIKDKNGIATVVTIPPEEKGLIDILTKKSVEIYVIRN